MVINKPFKNIHVFVLLVVAFVLKFVSLGYSNYQGDEIKALFMPKGPSFMEGWQFLLDQRKGPLQFLITFLTKQIDPTYSNEFLTRLPFAIAAFLSVLFFYKWVQRLFGKRVAFYAGFFFATNGFLVAFSRIAQYQSFVILFSILTLFCLEKFAESNYKKFSYFYIAFLFWALGMLAHYDSFFIAPAVLKYMIDFWRNTSKKTNIISTLGAILVFLLGIGWFYIPFALTVSQSTMGYWTGRLSGTVSTKLSSSIYLFKVYQPIYVIYIYAALSFIGGIAFLVKKYMRNYWYIVLWLLAAVIFWEVIVYIPGTHIYTYLIPLFIIMGIGVKYCEEIWIWFLTKLKLLKFRYASAIFIAVIFSFIFLQSYAIFVDHTKEYPWQQEKFLIWTFPEPTAIYHLSMFGFPYYREWEGISQFIKRHPNVTAYSTNERESISRFYIPLVKGTDKAGFYVFVKYPQSFTNQILSDKALYWANKYPPIYTFSRGGSDLVSIYEMPVGTKEEIIKAGY